MLRPVLTQDQIEKAGYFISKNGRLLERKLYEYFFENGSQQACLKALGAYQNADGGFGNGLEPDLLCPDSTAIGAETAMVLLDLLDCSDSELAPGIFDWIAARQNAAGFIEHPPANLARYPYQPWWANPDKERILSLAGMMKKWGTTRPGIFEKARGYFQSAKVPEDVGFYHYPYYIYLKYCSVTAADRAQFSGLVQRLPAFLNSHRSYYPLFSRYWFPAAETLEKQFLETEAAFFVNAIHADGDIDTPYPEYPWWRPIFLLDGLIQLKKMGFL